MPLSLTISAWTSALFRAGTFFRSIGKEQKVLRKPSQVHIEKSLKRRDENKNIHKTSPEKMGSIQVEILPNTILLHFDEYVSIGVLLSDLEQTTGSIFTQIQPSSRSLFEIRLCFGERLLHPSLLRLVRSYVQEKTGVQVRGLSCSKDSMKRILSASIGLAIHESRAKSLIVHQTFRSGMMYSVDGELLIYGDVHDGAHIQATGSITIMGVLSGTAHAGSSGNRKAKIFASSMEHPKLWIDTHFVKEENIQHKRGYSVVQLSFDSNNNHITMGGT